MNAELNTLLREVLMCSVFVSPLDPGLTNDELQEIGRQSGFQDGEIGDTIPHVSKQLYGRSRYIANSHDIQYSEVWEVSDPPLLNVAAADFIIEALNDRIKADGVRQARLDGAAIVERAVSAGHERLAAEGAITCLALARVFDVQDGVVTPPNGSTGPRALLGQHNRPHSSRPKTLRHQALSLVRDVVSRRTDGRPRQSEPLDGFPDALERIGFRHFRIWWTQTVSELRRSDPASAPVSCVVLSAALVEGALTFAAKHSRDRQLGAFQSSDFDGDPRTWKAEKLIESASRGGSAAILTPQLRARAEHLNRTRQRVHVGRLLGEHPGGVPDLRPEEGREAKGTAEQLVRAVLDWLDRASAT